MLRTLLALTRISGIADAFIKKHLSVFYFSSPEKAIQELASESKKISESEIDEHLVWADSVIAQCEELGIEILPIYNESYPVKLKEMSNPPAVLYLLGNKKLLDKPIVSIIGTRHSTSLGNAIANKVGSYFSMEYALCNGLVEGIDKNSVISSKGVYSNVIGILSGGLDFRGTSSKTTIDLAEKTLNNGGLLISEVEPTRKEDKFSGSKSSRIQAGLSCGLILIQSSIDGGSKYTIKAISKLNRVIGFISFQGNPEYETSNAFSANRLFAKEGIRGIAKMCEIEKLNALVVKGLIPIHTSTDYHTFEEITTSVLKSELFQN